MFTKNIFLTGKNEHTTKHVLRDYHLTGQPTVPLKYYPRKNAAMHTHQYLQQFTNPDHDTNHKQLWSYIKSKKQENFGIPTLKNNNGTYNSYESRANILNNYFSTVTERKH